VPKRGMFHINTGKPDNSAKKKQAASKMVASNVKETDDTTPISNVEEKVKSTDSQKEKNNETDMGNTNQ